MSVSGYLKGGVSDPVSWVSRAKLSAMKEADRRSHIERIDRDLSLIQKLLDECVDQLAQISFDFKNQRRDLLRERRRQTKRPQSTSLVLKVTYRQRSAMQVPRAEWRSIRARGHSAQRVHEASSNAASAPADIDGKGKLRVTTDAITMNKKFGWRINDLVRHANPVELDLIKVTESKLLPIRKRVAGLTSRAKSLLRSRYLHVHYLSNANNEAVAPRKLTKRQERERANEKNQFEVMLGLVSNPGIPERPQFRKPRA